MTLGLEPLCGSHIESNRSTSVTEILQKNDIADRVLSVTTDNATNNHTMITSIQGTIFAQGTSKINVFRAPCLASNIQFSLNQLLGKMSATLVRRGRSRLVR